MGVLYTSTTAVNMVSSICSGMRLNSKLNCQVIQYRIEFTYMRVIILTQDRRTTAEGPLSTVRVINQVETLESRWYTKGLNSGLG